MGNPLTLEEQEKAKVLMAHGGTYCSIARTLERSPHTIKKYLTTSDVQVEVIEKKAELATLYEGLARDLVESIKPADIERSSMLQRVTASGIALDKMRLLRGESTANVSMHTWITDHINQRWSRQE